MLQSSRILHLSRSISRLASVSITTISRFNSSRLVTPSSHVFNSQNRWFAKINDSIDDAETSIQAKARVIDLDEKPGEMTTIFVGGWSPKWLTVPDRFASESGLSNTDLVLARLRGAANDFQVMMEKGAFVDLTAPEDFDSLVHIIVPKDVYEKYWSLDKTESPSSGVDTKGGHAIPSNLLKEIKRFHDEEPTPEPFKTRLENYSTKDEGKALIGWEFRADAEQLFSNLKMSDLISELKQIADWLEGVKAAGKPGNFDVFFEDGQIVCQTTDPELAKKMSIPALYAK